MPESKRKIASKNSIDYEKITEMDQTILRRQKRAELRLVTQRANKSVAGRTLTEEFFEGLNIV